MTRQQLQAVVFGAVMILDLSRAAGDSSSFGAVFAEVQAIKEGDVTARVTATQRLAGSHVVEPEDQSVAILALTWALRDPNPAVSRAAVTSVLWWSDRIPSPAGLGVSVLETMFALRGTPMTRATLSALGPTTLCEIGRDLGLRFTDRGLNFLRVEGQAVRFLRDYAVDPDLGRDISVVLAVKDRDQLKRNREAVARVKAAITRTTFVGSDRPRRYRPGGLVAAFSLDRDSLDEADALWTLPNIPPEPYTVAFRQGEMVVGAGEALLRYRQLGGQPTEQRTDWLRNIHTVEFSPDGKRLLVSSPAFDSLLELDAQTGDVLRHWNLWDDGEVNRAPAMGHYLTRLVATADRLHEQHREVMYVDDPRDPAWPDTGIPVYRRVGLNGATYLAPDRIGMTVLHTGTAHVLTPSIDRLETVLYGLWDPHGFGAQPGGYHVANTAKGSLELLDERFALTRYLRFDTMPGVVRDAQAGEWLQACRHDRGNIYMVPDMHRSTLWLVNAARETYRGLRFPDAWAVQSAVNTERTP